MEIQSPYNIIQVFFERKFKQFGYVFRRELIDISDMVPGEEPLRMVNCYSLDTGHWIGDAKTAGRLCRKRGLRKIQKSNPRDCVASIGFDEKKQRWAGWSHRAICSFSIGDRLFEENYGDDNTLFVEHGSKVIKNLEQAKEAAKRFSDYVS